MAFAVGGNTHEKSQRRSRHRKEIQTMIQSLKQVNISPAIPPIDRSFESIRVFREVWLKRKEERQKKVLDLNSTSAG